LSDTNPDNDSNDSIRDGKRRRSHVCTVCEKRFKQSLKEHSKRHAGDQFYSCSQCEKCFVSKECLRIHMNVHSGKYKCSQCGKCFCQTHALEIHQRIHSGEKPFECSVCGKRFSTASYLTIYSQQNSQWRETLQLSCVLQSVLPVFLPKGTHDSPHRTETVQVFTV